MYSNELKTYFMDTPITLFTKFLNRVGETSGQLLYLSCGDEPAMKELAEKGYDVEAFCPTVTDAWPQKDDTYHLAVDTSFFKNLTDPEERAYWRRELTRVLREDSLALVVLGDMIDLDDAEALLAPEFKVVNYDGPAFIFKKDAITVSQE